jgi:hypothetical protein
MAVARRRPGPGCMHHSDRVLLQPGQDPLHARLPLPGRVRAADADRGLRCRDPHPPGRSSPPPDRDGAPPPPTPPGAGAPSIAYGSLAARPPRSSAPIGPPPSDPSPTVNAHSQPVSTRAEAVHVMRAEELLAALRLGPGEPWSTTRGAYLERLRIDRSWPGRPTARPLVTSRTASLRREPSIPRPAWWQRAATDSQSPAKRAAEHPCSGAWCPNDRSTLYRVVQICLTYSLQEVPDRRRAGRGPTA